MSGFFQIAWFEIYAYMFIISNHSFLMAEYSSIVWISFFFFLNILIHQLVNSWIVSNLGAIMNKVAINIQVESFRWTCFHFSHKSLEVGCWIIWNVYKKWPYRFSKLRLSVCIPTSNFKSSSFSTSLATLGIISH